MNEVWRMLTVGIVGHGVVGSGVAEILLENADEVAKSAGQGVRIGGIVELRDFSHLAYHKLFTADVDQVLDDPQIDVIVECVGGAGFAYACAKRALQAGKHFVTSNKELVAKCGDELLDIAREKNVQFLYEASTGGGIPAIHPMQHCLGANRITRVAGILNGTTNFILTRMRDGGISFDTALREAQELGYAEADPSADVLGHDARRKINILAHVAYGALLDSEPIPTEGIDKLTREDMLYARELGRSVKLLGVAERVLDGYTAWVCPTMLPASHPLSNVSDVFNGVLVTGDRVGEVMFFGRGAGKDATASAVVGDVISIAKGAPMTDRVPSSLPFVPNKGGVARFFARMRGGETESETVVRQLPGARIVWPENRLMVGTFAVITPEGDQATLRDKLLAMKCLEGTLIRYEGT
jgi:homoserine dehydrogenase